MGTSYQNHKSTEWPVAAGDETLVKAHLSMKAAQVGGKNLKAADT